MNRNTPSSQSSQNIPLPQPQNIPHPRQQDAYHKRVLSGRMLALPEEETNLLMSQLGTFAWQNLLLRMAPIVHEGFVKQFYAYAELSYENDDQNLPVITSFVQGRTLSINRGYLANLLGLQNIGECIYIKKRRADLRDNIDDFNEAAYYQTFADATYTGTGGQRMHERHLLGNVQHLSAFIDANILPNTATSNGVSMFQGFIIYCILNRRLLNLPFIILKHMDSICHHKLKYLGFGALLTTIFGQLGIQINENECVALQSPLNMTYIRKRRNHPFRIVVGQNNQPQDEDEQEWPQQQQQWPQQQQEWPPWSEQPQDEQEQGTQELEDPNFFSSFLNQTR